MQGRAGDAFGARVRDLRRARGLTQEALAQKGGLSVEAVGRIERGAFSPTLETMKKLAEGLGVPFHALFHGHEHPTDLARICRYISNLASEQRKVVWSMLLNLFGAERSESV